MTATIAFVCPSCRTSVRLDGDAYMCAMCGRRYPVILGIPDFRLTSDPWLSIEEDRQKGLALDERTRGASLAETVEAYWRMTPTTSADRARRFAGHVAGAERRSREWLESKGLLESPDRSTWIDLGCGTADLAVLCARQRQVLAVDIAFRWLVVAHRRVEAQAASVTLVCADAGALPFGDGVAGRVLSLGLLEHVDDYARVLKEARRVVAPGGRVHVRTTNRYSLLAEPHVGVWGVGWLPRDRANAYVKWRTGEGYQHVRPPSARDLRHAFDRAGFDHMSIHAAIALPSEAERIGGGRLLAAAYNRCVNVPIAGAVLTRVAPLLEGEAVP